MSFAFVKKSGVLLWVLLCLIIGNTLAMARPTLMREGLPEQVQVNTEALNVRTGPSTDFSIITVIEKEAIADCVGKLNDWYILRLEDDTVGLAKEEFLTALDFAEEAQEESPKPSEMEAIKLTPTITFSPTKEMRAESEEKEKLLKLVNQARAEVGATPLVLKDQVNRVAKIKAEDMVKNKYFSHTSPTHGSPFVMMSKYEITYNYAGENLAGNQTAEGAHEALMKSEGHRKNILNPNYRYLGIGIAKSSIYGKIYVEMFTD